MKQKPAWEEILGVLMFLLAAGMLGLSVYTCFSCDIWYDELFTMGLGNQSCGGLISMTARDVHPPLYYLIVKGFLAVFRPGTVTGRVAAAKAAGCVPFLLLLVWAAVRIRKEFGIYSAGLFAFCLLSMPQLPQNTVEIRMYGYTLLWLLLLFGSACVIGAGRGERRHWILLTLSAVAACYTHYFAGLAACLVYLGLLVILLVQRRKEAWKAFWLSSGLCILAFLPWLLLALTGQLSQVKESYWIQPISLRTPVGCLKFIFQPGFPGGRGAYAGAGLLIGAAVLSLIAGFYDRQRRLIFLSGSGVLAGLAVTGILISLLFRPIFVYRYLLPALGIFWYSFAIMTGSVKNKGLKLIVTLLVLVLGIGNFCSFFGEEQWKKKQMNQALEVLGEIGETDIVLFNFDQAQGVVSYYLENETYLWYGTTEPLIESMFPENHTLVEDFSDEAGIERIRGFLQEGKTVWFAGSGNAREEIREKWEKAGILSSEGREAMIERYWIKLFRLSLTD